MSRHVVATLGIGMSSSVARVQFVHVCPPFWCWPLLFSCEVVLVVGGVVVGLVHVLRAGVVPLRGLVLRVLELRAGAVLRRLCHLVVCTVVGRHVGRRRRGLVYRPGGRSRPRHPP